MPFVTALRLVAFALGVAAFSAGLPAVAQSDETFEIMHRPRPGDHWNLSAQAEKRLEAWLRTSDQDSILIFTKSESSSVQGQVSIGEVDSAGSHTRELRFTHVKSELSEWQPTTGSKVVSLDSDNLTDPALPEEVRQSLAGLKQVRYEATIGPEGQLLSYRAEPEGNLFAQEYASVAVKSIQQDYSELTRSRLRVGETWQMGKRMADGSLGGSSTVSIEYELTGKLVRVDTRDGARHALIKVESADRKMSGTYDPSALTQAGFSFEMLAEYDFAKGRIVMVLLTTTVRGTAVQPQNGETVDIKVTNIAREADLNTPSWMIDEAVASERSQQEAMPALPARH